jgi:hypothetical protein
MLALVYAVLGRRDDVCRLADRAEHEDREGAGDEARSPPLSST